MPDEQQNWPKTVEEAVERLLVIVDKDSQESIKNLPEKDLVLLHLPFGMQVRNTFGLWAGNIELRNDCGSRSMHPDDASDIIIRVFWKRLNNRADWNLYYKPQYESKSWKDAVSDAETLEEAVNWLVANLPEEVKDFIKITGRNNIMNLSILYAADFQRIFGLRDSNRALISAFGGEALDPINASRAILVALWNRLNGQET